MKNVLLQIEYVGTRYFGFQAQKKPGVHEPTVQAVIERALAKLFGEAVAIVYASRTDRGVHAKAQAVSFKIDSAIPCANIKRALNIILPIDIRVKTVKIVPVKFHARFSAASKTYRYLIRNTKEPSVFYYDRAWHISEKLDIDAMRRVSRLLIGKHDFKLFAKSPAKYHTCVRHIMRVDIKRRGSIIGIDIEAAGFLRAMARSMVYFLVQAGLKRMSIDQARALCAQKITYHPEPAPAHGLCLEKVVFRQDTAQ